MRKIWEKRIVERMCEWTGINGKHFRTKRYIRCAFFGDPDGEPYLSEGANGCAFCSGGSSAEDCVRSINRYIVEGEEPITIEEVEKEIEKMRREIKENPQNHLVI